MTGKRERGGGLLAKRVTYTVKEEQKEGEDPGGNEKLLERGLHFPLGKFLPLPASCTKSGIRTAFGLVLKSSTAKSLCPRPPDPEGARVRKRLI